MKELISSDLYILLLTFIGGIVAMLIAFGTYYKGVKDGKTSDRIDSNVKTNVDLTKEVKKLESLNHLLSQNIDTIVRENKLLAEYNIRLSDTTNRLIHTVEDLTISSKQLISTVNRNTEKEFAQNAISGNLNLRFDQPLKDNDSVTLVIGGLSMTNFVWEWNSGKGKIKIRDLMPFTLKIVNQELIFGFVCYDLQYNWIAEIENNYWRRNPLIISKFNYDEKGFEVIDNQNRVAFNIDIHKVDNKNVVNIQGVIPFIAQGIILVAHGNRTDDFTINSKTDLNQLSRELMAIHIEPMFDYSGEQWLHKRRKYSN